VHQIFGANTSLIVGIVLSFIYLCIFVAIFRNRNKPHIQSRSPILMLMITIGVYFDTLLKLLINSISYEQIDLKC
jgi:uncharacterized membrane protein